MKVAPQIIKYLSFGIGFIPIAGGLFLFSEGKREPEDKRRQEKTRKDLKRMKQREEKRGFTGTAAATVAVAATEAAEAEAKRAEGNIRGAAISEAEEKGLREASLMKGGASDGGMTAQSFFAEAGEEPEKAGRACAGAEAGKPSVVRYGAEDLRKVKAEAGAARVSYVAETGAGAGSAGAGVSVADGTGSGAAVSAGARAVPAGNAVPARVEAESAGDAVLARSKTNSPADAVRAGASSGSAAAAVCAGTRAVPAGNALFEDSGARSAEDGISVTDGTRSGAAVLAGTRAFPAGNGGSARVNRVPAEAAAPGASVSVGGKRRECRGTELESSGLSVRQLMLAAILLAAGAVLKYFIGSLFSVGMKPNFIIAMYCLAILLIRPKLKEAAIIGLLAGAVCQFFPGTPYLNFASELAGAMLMALLVRLVPQGRFSLMPALCTFIATVASGTLFVVLLYSFFFISGSAAAPLAVFGGIIFGTAAINSIIVQLLYLPAAAALRLSSVH